MSKSQIKKIIFSGSDEEFRVMQLDRATPKTLAPAVRAEYFKRRQSLAA